MDAMGTIDPADETRPASSEEGPARPDMMPGPSEPSVDPLADRFPPPPPLPPPPPTEPVSPTPTPALPAAQLASPRRWTGMRRAGVAAVAAVVLVAGGYGFRAVTTNGSSATSHAVTADAVSNDLTRRAAWPRWPPARNARSCA